VKIPDSDDPIWLVQRRRVLVVGGNAELGILKGVVRQEPCKYNDNYPWGPVNVGDRPVLAPSFIPKGAYSLDPLAFRVISSGGHIQERRVIELDLYLLASLRTNSVIPGVVVIIVECTLDNLRRLLYEAQELRSNENICSLLLSEF
jgi:hypothetical protein